MCQKIEQCIKALKQIQFCSTTSMHLTNEQQRMKVDERRDVLLCSTDVVLTDFWIGSLKRTLRKVEKVHSD